MPELRNLVLPGSEPLPSNGFGSAPFRSCRFVGGIVRRFHCDDARCIRRIFAERFGDEILAPYARRTGRLETIVHHLGLALGGRPGAGFARRLRVPVSNDTLIRVVRRRAAVMAKASGPPRVVGIDDFAFRRNCRYGTIVVDLERRRILKLLPDREPATVIAWLKAHAFIEVVARDRGGGYGEAVARALPAVQQVADRWHLMENASRAFLDAVRGALHRIRSVMGATTLDPALLSSAERLQVDGWARRRQTNDTVIAMRDDGRSIKEIARAAGLARERSDGSSAANGTTSSGPVNLLWRHTCRGWMSAGMSVTAMVPHSRGSCSPKASPEAYAS